MKTILVLYHSQGGTMDGMAHRFARGAAREEEVVVSLKRAQDATLDDLLRCDAIAIGSPEYFGTMAGMIKDFFDRTFQAAQDQTIGLPFVLFVCAGNDGRGAISTVRSAATVLIRAAMRSMSSCPIPAVGSSSSSISGSSERVVAISSARLRP